ncbi:hypothetical protein [Neobacillus niacini]|uniref:hypothetical protein n=1 Tax=Neobacillus niacini TaxID=86668 RepID=UPI001C8E7D44|nr:hypothetical protein [Neobacillus niacini]MBY0144396.1 hypothetical protein [Neobacillus niacini]
MNKVIINTDITLVASSLWDHNNRHTQAKGLREMKMDPKFFQISNSNIPQMNNKKPIGSHYLSVFFL